MYLKYILLKISLIVLKKKISLIEASFVFHKKSLYYYFLKINFAFGEYKYVHYTFIIFIFKRNDSNGFYS